MGRGEGMGRVGRKGWEGMELREPMVLWNLWFCGSHKCCVTYIVL